MSWAFLLQTLASAAAIAILVGFTAWARISRPPPKLDAAGALRVLADEFPDASPATPWIAADGEYAVRVLPDTDAALSLGMSVSVRL